MKHKPNLLPALLVITLTALGVGCSQEPDPAAPPSVPASSAETSTRALERGREVVSQAGKALSGVLLEALRTGGPTNALPLCSVQAIPLTASLAQTHQVQLRRVSHRPRNSANEANADEKALIQSYQTALTQGQNLQPTARTSAQGAVTFYAPIVITTNLCLTCHGTPDETLHADVIPLLHSLYPTDQATGFALGDLRGLWRIDFPPGSLRQAVDQP